MVSTLRSGSTQATVDLLHTIRSGVDLSQLAAHVRNARRADSAVEAAYGEIDFTIDGPQELPPPAQLLSSMNSQSLSSRDTFSDDINSSAFVAHPDADASGQDQREVAG